MKRALAQVVLVVLVLAAAGVMMRVIAGMRPQVVAVPPERRAGPGVVQHA